MELETDKAVVEVPSSVSGTVQDIRVKEGDKIKVGQVIFTVDGAEAKAAPQPAAQTAPPARNPLSKHQRQHRHSRIKPPLHLRLRYPQYLLPPHLPPVPANSSCRNSARTFPRAISCA